MIIAKKIQSFLSKKLREKKITRKGFAEMSQIPYPTVNKMLNAVQNSPDIKNLIKISTYFNCTLDEILGRKNYIVLTNSNFVELSTEQLNINLKEFINTELAKTKLNTYQLSKELNFGQEAIYKFIKRDNKEGTLGSEIILALADHFKVSVDRMIGRVRA